MWTNDNKQRIQWRRSCCVLFACRIVLKFKTALIECIGKMKTKQSYSNKKSLTTKNNTPTVLLCKSQSRSTVETSSVYSLLQARKTCSSLFLLFASPIHHSRKTVQLVLDSVKLFNNLRWLIFWRTRGRHGRRICWGSSRRKCRRDGGR
jgi:hypothetical protein